MIPIQDNVPSRGVPLVTWGLILLNGLVFLYELSLPPDDLERLFAMRGFVPGLLWTDPHAAWTLLTCLFLHGGWTHFVGNMWALYLFGDNVEDRMGSVRYLGFYLLCGAAAGLTHCAVDPDSAVPTVGASGAVAGVLGAYFVLFPTARVITLVPLFLIPFLIEIPAALYLALWFATQLLSGTLSPGDPQGYGVVAWWAHVGGFVTGAALQRVFRPPGRRRADYPDEYRPW